MKDDIKHYYDVVCKLTMKNFVEILMADLAKNSFIYDINTTDRIAFLPFNFSEVMHTIMFENNGWGIHFADVIDINDYYSDENAWMLNFSIELNKFLEDKKFEADLYENGIKAYISKEKITQINEKYDKSIQLKVNHFTNIITSLCMKDYTSKQFDIFRKKKIF